MDEEDDLNPESEWRFRAAAIPIALVLALVFNAFPTTHMLQRTFLSMIPHELGHAITGWWTGFAAIPGLWKTMIPETRGVFAIALAAVIAIGFAYIGRRFERRWAYAVAAILVVAQIIGTTSSVETAQMAITFGGDAGAMVIGTLLIMTFFAPEGSKFRLGAVRWGLLVIGAASYVDVAMTWWHARDHAKIPFGEIEGVGLSDPSKLSEVYSWSDRLIVSRYLTVAAICLAVILGVWIRQTLQMRRRALESAA